jgi:hypothetical protein
MTYIKDGSPIKVAQGKIIPNVLYYGWLSRSVLFNNVKEKQDYKVFKELADSVKHEMTRGHHVCEFCGWEDYNYGNGEMWLSVENTTYVFPRMIWHYIKDHDYGLPPQIYIPISFGEYEILTEQDIKDIHNYDSSLIVNVPYLVCRAMWKKERYKNMADFFDENSWDWQFRQASVQDNFYTVNLNLSPKDIETLFEDDPQNFPDEIVFTRKNNQNQQKKPGGTSINL